MDLHTWCISHRHKWRWWIMSDFLQVKFLTSSRLGKVTMLFLDLIYVSQPALAVSRLCVFLMDAHCWLTVKCQKWRQRKSSFSTSAPFGQKTTVGHAPAWSRPTSSAGARWSPLPLGSYAGRLRPPASCSPSSPSPRDLAHAFAAHPPVKTKAFLCNL